MYDGTLIAVAAKALWEQGYTPPLPVNQQLVDNVRRAFQTFVAWRTERRDAARWSFTRPGEDEPDLGLIIPADQQRDQKWFMHYEPALDERVRAQIIDYTEHDLRLLHCMRMLRTHVYTTITQPLASVLDQYYEQQLTAALDACWKEPAPYSTTTLRALFYEARDDQTGAQPHWDKDTLGIHLGDAGGQLEAELPNGEWVSISPPPGHAVAFFGVKVLWETNGVCQPLRHRSTVTPGQDRFALVQFHHTHVPGVTVRSSREAYEQFKRERA